MIGCDQGMKVLITGASGFVAPHLVADLRQAGIENLRLTAKAALDHPELGAIDALDVTDRQAVNDAISVSQPDFIVHLAGIASPSEARRDPKLAWNVHLNGSLNVAYAVLEHAPRCVLLSIGSGMVYGGRAADGPVSEQTLLDPMDTYAASKAAADIALGSLVYKGLRCIRLRPFNHIGPGQSEGFVAPAFAMQIARIEAGLQPPVIRVGNLEAVRDILDVRDVTKAYVRALRKARDLPRGAIFNIASGVGVRVSELLDSLLASTDAQIRIEQDPERMRPSEVSSMIGDGTLARRLLDWEPEHTLSDTLTDVLEDCRRRLEAEQDQRR